MGKKNKKNESPDPGGFRLRREFFKRHIVECQKPVLESERVFHPVDQFDLREIIAHVESCTDEFVTADHPEIAPIIPKKLRDVQNYDAPYEKTWPRTRMYFIDREGILRAMNCEVRQEKRENGLYKQTVKTGAGGTMNDPTLNRWEQAARLDQFGFNVYAIGDEDLRRKLIETLKSMPKPAIRMVSQRTRLSYFPEGNQNILMELAVEPVHFGETFHGFAWSAPKLDLEIKRGPKHNLARRAILDREEQRLLRHFPLQRELSSSPTRGMEAIFNDLKSAKTQKLFERLPETEQWRSAAEFLSKPDSPAPGSRRRFAAA